MEHGIEDEKSELFDTITRENCGYFLRKIRLHLGEISMMECAKVLGVSRTTIKRIEDNRNTLPTDRITPSNDFINRLKALQIIGLSALKEQWKVTKQGNDFADLAALGFPQSQIDELLEPGQIFTNLTAVGILAGISTIQELHFNNNAIRIKRVPLLAGAGLMKGLNEIFASNKLSLREEGAFWDIHYDEEKSSFIPINSKWERKKP